MKHNPQDEMDGQTIISSKNDIKRIKGIDFLVKNLDPKNFRQASYKSSSSKKFSIQLNNDEYTYERKLSKKSKKITLSISKNNSSTQIFYECNIHGDSSPYCGDDGYQEFHWAGDLDGDGKLDLIVMTTLKYSSQEYHLYLSSKANEGELIKKISTSYGYIC